MSLLHKARKLESTLARTFDGAAHTWTGSGARGPLEVIQAIVDAIEHEVEPAGRGTHVFPFNRITVSLPARSRDARARFAALVDAEPTLHDRVCARLAAAGCEPAHVQISVAYVDEAASDWPDPDFHIDFDRVTPADAPAREAPSAQALELTVVHGATEKPSYVFSQGCVNIGRCAEVRDSRNRLLRTNDVVFSESFVGPNTTVSRRHAHIEYSRALQYRVCDDGSAHGTGIVRDGRTINVPPGPRGIRLQSGDELLLGEARLRVKTG